MKNQNPDSTVTFPEVIEHKGRIAKIYRAKNRDTYRYEVKYRDPDGEWKRETFDEHDAARKHANHIVKQLEAASQPFLMLRGKERFIYERALDLLRSTGQPLDMAVAEFVEAKAKLKDVCTLREAVETTRNLRAKPVSSVTVKQVVDEFVKVKNSEGLSHLYRRDLRTRLARFADYFKCPLSVVTTPDLVRFVNDVGGSRRNRRNYLTTIGTLMNHCKMMGHFLRHSFISYRVAVVKNLPQVAMEAGNSVSVIQRDYPPLLVPCCGFVAASMRGMVPMPAYVPSQIIHGGIDGVLKSIEAMWPTARRLLFSDSIAAPAGWSKPSLTRSKQ